MPEGEYEIQLSASLNDPRLTRKIQVEGEKARDDRKKFPAYFERKTKTFTIPDKQFEALLGGKTVPDVDFKRGEYTLGSTLEQLQRHSLFVRLLIRIGKSFILKGVHGDTGSPVYKMQLFGMTETPVQVLPSMTGNMVKMKFSRAAVDFANGKVFAAWGKLLGKDK